MFTILKPIVLQGITFNMNTQQYQV